jgi:hypothetical protein
VPGVQDEWTALYRYDNDEHASAWLESDERRRLLVPGREVGRSRLDVTGAAVSIGFLTLAALVFWLCTTQLWHLP